jgi:uncharacterized protein (TIGR02266 family)
VPLAIEVAPRDAPPRVEYATNLSIGGLCLHARAALRVGEGVVLTFALPGEAGGVRVRGRVIWCETPDAAAAARFREIGVRFEGLSDPERERIVRFVRECDADAAPLVPDVPRSL